MGQNSGLLSTLTDWNSTLAGYADSISTGVVMPVALTLLENHAIIQRVDGKFNQGGCKFVILPTILTAVSGEKLNAVVSVLGKEDADEEAEEESVD